MVVVRSTDIFVIEHLLYAEIKRILNVVFCLCNAGIQYIVGTFKCSEEAFTLVVAAILLVKNLTLCGAFGPEF